MLISPEYQQMMQEVHEKHIHWGAHGGEHADLIMQTVRELPPQYPQDVLDYGCGKGDLAASLPFPIKEYDPAIPEKKAKAIPADIVHCNEVLQHVEPSCLDSVLEDIARCTKRICFIWAKIAKSQMKWPDGQNATMQLQPAWWWFGKIADHFQSASIVNLHGGERIIVTIRR